MGEERGGGGRGRAPRSARGGGGTRHHHNHQRARARARAALRGRRSELVLQQLAQGGPPCARRRERRRAPGPVRLGRLRGGAVRDRQHRVLVGRAGGARPRLQRHYAGPRARAHGRRHCQQLGRGTLQHQQGVGAELSRRGTCNSLPAACRLPPAACRLPPAACRLPPAISSCLLATARPPLFCPLRQRTRARRRYGATARSTRSAPGASACGTASRAASTPASARCSSR
jgi:hypothetical protein